MKLDLATLKRIKQSFDLQSDGSTMCHGYRILCKLIRIEELTGNPPLERLPFKCPVCGGRGKVQNGYYNVSGIGSTTDASPEKCKSCNGIGYVWDLYTQKE